MSAPFDVMAWMQKAYIDGQAVPWYRKIGLKAKLFIERNFKRVKGTPGAAKINAVLNESRSTREKIAEALPPPIDRSRDAIARMWDAL